MTSSTDTLRSDPFPPLGELLVPGDGGALAELRQRARAEGYEDGFAAGRAEGFDVGAAAGRALVADRVERVLAEVAAAAERARLDDAAIAESLGAVVLDAALELARAVVGRELALAESPGRDALLRALRAAPREGRLVARLNPADAELLGADDVAALSDRPVELVADPDVEPGGCLLETSTGSVDALLSSALGRVAEALLGTTEEAER